MSGGLSAMITINGPLMNMGNGCRNAPLMEKVIMPCQARLTWESAPRSGSLAG